MEDFTHQTVVVTGCASGIGKAQCLAFLNHHATVIGIDKKQPDIDDDRFTYYCCDLSSKEEVDLLSLPETVDILCNTAGVLDDFLPSLETSVDKFQDIMNTNVLGTFMMTNKVLASMVKRQRGVIINMASIASVIPGGGGAAYTASKHAILGYTKQLVYDYAHQGIRINALAPGAVATPMNANDFKGETPISQRIEATVPCHRYATPEEIADITLFVASPRAQYICGDILSIDGGWINRNIPI